MVQPADAPEALVKAYSAGFDADDKMSWAAIAKNTAVPSARGVGEHRLVDSPYAREWLGPRGFSFGVALPVKEPIMGGYPGRTAPAPH